MHTSFCKAINWFAKLHCSFVCFLLFLLQVMSPWNKGSAEETNPLQLWACLFLGLKHSELGKSIYKKVLFTFSFFLYSAQRIKPRALHMLGKSSTTELHPRPLIHIVQKSNTCSHFLADSFCMLQNKTAKV